MTGFFFCFLVTLAKKNQKNEKWYELDSNQLQFDLVTNIFDNTVVHEKKENPSYVERKNHFQGSVSCVGGRTLCLSQTIRHGGS
jgi:hypothetical protein